jgi:5-methylcytosine-specific restriction endonuclease McrA
VTAQARKRQWRRDRDAAKAQRRQDRAMSPAKIAARSGPPRWQQVEQRTGAKCWLCGTRVYPDDRMRVKHGGVRLGATYPTVDYVVAIDRGGTYEPDNVRLAHRHCQAARQANPARTQYGRPPRTYPSAP